MKRSGSDLFYCVGMILATPASVLLALNADWLAARGANPRAAQAIQVVRYGSWMLAAVCPVMAVLLWRSWRKSRMMPQPPSEPSTETLESRTPQPGLREY